MKKPKFIIVTGGVLSGIGKGTASAAIGKLLVMNGLSVVPIKCDGYLNVDPGTLNPFEHGEVFVLDDGGEVDMDFGHYERFTGIDCKSDWNLTSGKIFKEIIEKERKGDYLGKTVQIFPHTSDYIREKYLGITKKDKADIYLIEIGGTVGDIENSWFIDAAKNLKHDVGQENLLYVHLTYIPRLDTVGEQKTKPAQRDIALLRQSGINPDIVLGRSKDFLTKKIKEKLTSFSDVEEKNIISAKDIESIYEIPIFFEKEGLLERIAEKFDFPIKDDFRASLKNLEQLVDRIKSPEKEVDIAICGKYTDLHDAYTSILNTLEHCSAHLSIKPKIKWIETTDIEEGKISLEDSLQGIKGVIIPGGFGKRGTEGKIDVVKYVRENNIPFLGLCFGFQLATIEYAKNVCKLDGANSTEMDEKDKKTKYPVIDVLPEQKKLIEEGNYGATMRLGGHFIEVKDNTLASSLYRKKIIRERFRHRYEVNPDYIEILEKNGFIFSGKAVGRNIMQILELKEHPYFIATQFHPEFLSKLEKPHPLFYSFLDAAQRMK